MRHKSTRARSPAAVSHAQRPEPAPASGNRRAREPEASGPRSAPRLSDRPTADRVLQQFRIILNAVKTHLQQLERRSGIGGVQVWALSLIHERPGLGVSQLAVELNVRQPTASSIVRNLALQGLIEVRREGPDRRSVQLHATASGGALLRRAPGPQAGLLPEALGALDKHTLGQLESSLQTLVDKLGADGRAASEPLSLSLSQL